MISEELAVRNIRKSRPGGANANSPALQRREKRENGLSPGGTAEFSHILFSAGNWRMRPSRAGLEDFSNSLQVIRVLIGDVGRQRVEIDTRTCRIVIVHNDPTRTAADSCRVRRKNAAGYRRR